MAQNARNPFSPGTREESQHNPSSMPSSKHSPNVYHHGPSWKFQDWLPWAWKHGEKWKVALFLGPAFLCLYPIGQIKTPVKKNRIKRILLHQQVIPHATCKMCTVWHKRDAGGIFWFLCFICFGHRSFLSSHSTSDIPCRTFRTTIRHLSL